MKTVLITGASGFIAGHVARDLAEAGHRVIGVSRSGAGDPAFDRVNRVALGDSIADVLSAQRVDVVLHTANHAGENEFDINVAGTARWFDEAASAGVGLQILLSTLSAAPDAPSDYGRAKHALENLFSRGNGISLRLGVVAGDGGMFARIRRSVGSGIVVPLLDNGSAPVYLLGIDFLKSAIRKLVETDGEGRRGRVWSLQQPEPFTLREVMQAIRRAYHYRSVFVPVPSLPVLWALSIFEFLRLKLPVSTTNIRGLRSGHYQKFPSDFAEFGGEMLTLDELVARVRDHQGR